MDFECTSCGEDVTRNQKFCASCGDELDWNHDEVDHIGSQESTDPIKDSSESTNWSLSTSRKHQITPLGMFLVSVLCVSLLAGGFYILRATGVIAHSTNTLVVQVHYPVKSVASKKASKLPCDNIPAEFSDLFTPVSGPKPGALGNTYGNVLINIYRDNSGSASQSLETPITDSVNTCITNGACGGENYEFSNVGGECIYSYSFTVDSLSRAGNIDVILGGREAKNFKVSNLKTSSDGENGIIYTLDFMMNPRAANGNWYPAGYSVFNYSNVAYMGTTNLKCTYHLYGCAGIYVISSNACTNGIHGELAEFDTTGTQIGYSATTSGAVAANQRAGLVFNYDHDNVAKILLSKLECT